MDENKEMQTYPELILQRDLQMLSKEFYRIRISGVSEITAEMQSALDLIVSRMNSLEAALRILNEFKIGLE